MLNELILRVSEISWSDIAGERPYYAPDVVTASLIELARAATEQQAAAAAGPLFSAGLVHNHSGAVHPAAVTAAPMLLDIVQLAHPEAVQAALLLLHYAMDFEPIPGFDKVATEDGPDIPLCCAIARCIQARRALLLEHDLIGQRLLEKADQHWRFVVSEASGGYEEESLMVTGKLDGIIPSGVQSADIRLAAGIAIDDAAMVRLECLSSAPRCEAWAMLYTALRAGFDDMVLFPRHLSEMG